MKTWAKLEYIENDHRITQDTDSAFLHTLQSALLLALKERGRLSEMQFRSGEKLLLAQQRTRLQRQRQKAGEEH